MLVSPFGESMQPNSASVKRTRNLTKKVEWRQGAKLSNREGAALRFSLEDKVADIVLPRFVIAQHCLPGGWRQAKKPEIPKPVVQQRIFGRVTAPAKITQMDSINLKGFELWEYRFWAAQQSEDGKSVIAECRGCMSVFSDIKNRGEHLGRMGCSKRLTAAYKLLLKDKICVICNMRSFTEKWGVPLCSKTCIEAWCQVETQPDALLAALALVGE